MKVQFLNPFVDAAKEVLLAEANIKVERGELSMDKNPVRVDEVTVVVSIAGQVSGMVILAFSSKLALKIVSRMMGEEFTEMNDLVHSGIAELGNVITGRASIKLAKAGYQSNISPPALILGRETLISTLDIPRVVVPLHADVGTIVAHLALREVQRANGAVAQPARPGLPHVEEDSGRILFKDGQ